MAMNHGAPCWYELTTSAGALGAAGAFYAKVLGWDVQDAKMPEFAYHVGSVQGAMVAGMMETPSQAAGMPPMWSIYFAVDNCDERASEIESAGGKIFVAPSDIPGTGRFAYGADPQGAAFGILQPLPMESDDDASGRAFAPGVVGHAAWNELMSSDPKAGYEFYAKLFGWTTAREMDMGAMGTYRVIACEGRDIGGLMGLGNAPAPSWLPYFGVESATNAIERTIAAGGQVHHGPIEVPGGGFTVVASDPQGAIFAMLAAEE